MKQALFAICVMPKPNAYMLAYAASSPGQNRWCLVLCPSLALHISLSIHCDGGCGLVCWSAPLICDHHRVHTLNRKSFHWHRPPQAKVLLLTAARQTWPWGWGRGVVTRTAALLVTYNSYIARGASKGLGICSVCLFFTGFSFNCPHLCVLV